jgi:hypothetical protein
MKLLHNVPAIDETSLFIDGNVPTWFQWSDAVNFHKASLRRALQWRVLLEEKRLPGTPYITRTIVDEIIFNQLINANFGETIELNVSSLNYRSLITEPKCSFA